MSLPRLLGSFLALVFLTAVPCVRANIPGGGTGTGANVTITDNGTTVTLANGIVSIIITKTDGSIHSISYTYNNSGTPTTNQLLSGGSSGGELYWLENSGSFLDGPFTETVVANTGSYAEISLSYASPSNGIMELHYSMLRGSPGFYVTPILTHRAQDAQLYITLRPNIYAGAQFNWMSVDADRNKLMEVSGGTTITCPTSPVENYLWTNGIYQGRYEDKYKYCADLYSLPAWGWSSVGTGGTNVGIWNVTASGEYYPGGPLERSLMEHIGTTILNVFTGGYFGLGTDGTLLSAEVWSKTYGPYFYYVNNVSSTITDPVQASQALYADALAQGAAEKTAWPYSWFSNANYAPASGRGTVTGTIAISDSGNPNASASGLWVGVVQQPTNNTSIYDFQEWTKPYQFWVKADASGNFSIPNVIAGSNYTLYAFGPGAPGTFMSQAQTGGSPPLITAIPAAPFGVTVTGGATTALGTITWTPTRYAPTVFEIGYPDRTARKFRHGEDYWVGDIGPSVNSPSPVWTKFMEYPFDFPNGPNYTVGTSRWSTDWNFIQPSVYSTTGTWNPTTSSLTFKLPTGTALTGNASLYLGLASDYYAAMVVTVNGKNLGSISGLTATPTTSVPTTGYYVGYGSSDTSIREGINGAFSDERLTFPASILNTGTTANTITIAIRQIGGSYFADHAMYDYLRLELTGYVPPAPASVSTYAGNSSVLLSWPTTPGATSYNLLRSTTNGSGYTSLATGIIGPICGSGPENATYVDNTAVNGTTYYYVVQSVNPVSASVNSPQSAAVTPSGSLTTSIPLAPTGVTAAAGSGSVSLAWSASNGASSYTVKRSTLYANGGGTYNNLGTITLSNVVTGTSYTDSSPTNGSTYAYSVVATNAAGSSPASTMTTTNPVAVAPAAGPTALTATAGQATSAGSITLNWAAVSGGVGYVVQRATSATGAYTLLYSLASLTAADAGLAANTTYYYQVATMNSGGTSAFMSASATTPPAAPTNVAASPGSSKVTLTWTAAAGATSYVIGRATTTGGAYTTLTSTATGTSYVDNAVINGTTYYYVVAAVGTGGTGLNSTEVNATPVGTTILTWSGSTNSTWDTTTSNWSNGSAAVAYADGAAVVFDDTATNNTVTISGTLSPNSVLFNNTTDTYMLTAATLAGPTALTKQGTGKLNITGTNTYTGGTTISGGTIAITGSTSNAQNGLGTGTITLQGGTLAMNGYGSSSSSNYGVLANAVNVPAGYAGTWQFPHRGGQSGAVTGAGPLTLQVNYNRDDISGSWSAFTGKVNVVRTSTGTTMDNFRLNNNGGFGTAGINLGSYVQMSTELNANNSFTIGELASTDGTAQLAGINSYNNSTPGSYLATYVVGGRNTDATFAGMITDGISPSRTAITKEGTGTWTLSGACSYTGATAVTGGTLSITGSLAGTSGLTIASGSTLALNGGTISVAGPVMNAGIVRLTGAASLASSGSFTNNGILDLINGLQSLPANLVNNGTVLDSKAIPINSVSVSAGGVFTVAMTGYAGHAYQLASATSLSAPNWQNVGTGQSVPGSQSGPVSVSLTDSSATGTGKFYRIVVTASP